MPPDSLSEQKIERLPYFNIEIRHAKFADRQAMLRLQIAALESIDDGKYSPKKIAALIKSKQYFYKLALYYYRFDRQILRTLDPSVTLVAIYETEIVGFAALELASITAVFVHPNYARQKIATRLLLALEKIAIDRGISSLIVTSSLNAQIFYASCGYEEIDNGFIFVNVDRVRIEIVQMFKRLPAKHNQRLFSFHKLLSKCLRLSIYLVRTIWNIPKLICLIVAEIFFG